MQKGVPFTEHDVSRDRLAASEMVRRTGQTGVPVVIVDDQVVVGFDRPRLEQLLATARARRPALGLRVADARSQAAKDPALAGLAGAYVGGVATGSPAAQAGVQVGDVIVAVDGRPVHGADDLQREILRSGRRLALTLVRRGQQVRAVLDL